MKKPLLFLTLIFVFLLSACSGPSALVDGFSTVPGSTAPRQAAAQGPETYPQQRSITVTGIGQVSLAPEMAYVYVGVQSQSDNVAEALSANNQKAQAISEALRGLGIDENDIQTSSFNIYPMQQYGPMGEVTGTLYNVDNTVYVTIRNLQTLGQMLDVTVRAGANSINGISFDVSEESKNQAVADARRLAVDSARSQAQALAEAAGVNLGGPLTLYAYMTGQPVPLYEAKGGFAADASQVPISAGQINIRVEVNASYAIE
jgi:uncharacterized protein